MPQTQVVLRDALSGQHVVIDDDALTMGVLEDMQSGQVGLMLESVASFIVGGDLPKGTDKAGLRRLTPLQFKALIEGITAFLLVPKAS